MSRLLFAGLATLDLVHYTQDLPQAGTKGTADNSVLDIGGPAANAAITAAQLGGDVGLATVLGSDPLAVYARSAVEAHGIVVREISIDDTLPVASVWVDGGGGRTVLSTDNRALRIEPVTESFVADDTDVVLLDGHYPELQLAVAREATTAGIPIVLDCGRWRGVFAELLPMASDAILSAGFRTPGTEDLTREQTAMMVATTYNLRLCAITGGSDPIWAATGDGLASVVVPQLDVVDTLGAGDVLHGAYVFHRYQSGLSELEALTESASAASISCTHRGVRH